MFKLSDILLSAKKSQRHPLEIMFVGFIYTVLSLFISFWILPEHSSLLMVFLTVISCLYLVQGILIREEKKENNYTPEYSMIKQHLKTLGLLIILFLGFILAFTLLALFLPQEISSSTFKVQLESLEKIRSITGSSISNDALGIIISNNLRVLTLSILLAIFYGAGAIFILVWNASIMGLAIALMVKNTSGLVSLPYAFLKYFIHGIPEMFAYFTAALAGGIIFVSILNGDLQKSKMKRIIIDVTVTIILSIVLIVIAGLIEVYITPII